MKNIIAILLNFVLVHAIAQTPIITNISPTSGPVGTSVTLTGTNFSATASNNTIWFGAAKAVVTSSTTTSLVATVPVGATHAPIRVLVNGKIGESQNPFISTFSAGFISSNSMAQRVDFAGNTGSSGFAIGDLNEDGKLDLAVTNNSSNTVSVFRNTSTIDTISSSSFAAKFDFVTGVTSASPCNVSIGDLDGDGKLDLAVANSLSNSVSLLRNTSTSGPINSGSFGPQADFVTPTNATYVIIADLDGDGKLDLVLPNNSLNTLSVYRNISTNGSLTSGSFATKVDFATGSFPISIAIGDLDGDSKLDLAVANAQSNSISVLRNISTSGTISSGSFTSKVDFSTGTSPYNVSIADLDGDGKLDLAVANSISNNVSVLRNTSTIGALTSSSFATKVNFTTGTGTSPRSISIGDIDGDGKLDLAVANYGTGSSNSSISVFRNTSTLGTITNGSFATRVDYATAAGAINVLIGDIDGDGKQDLISKSGGTFSVFRNIGQYKSPTIKSFTPATSAIGVSILGTNFTGTTSVKFGGTEALSFTIRSDTSMYATIGKGATGVITVTTPAGSANSNKIFSFIIPTITNIFPSSGAIGTSVTITGKCFSATVANNKVWFGNVKANVTASTDTSLLVTVPLGAMNEPIRVLVNGRIAQSPKAFIVTYSNGFINSSSMLPKVDFATGTYPYGSSIGDIDGDGKLDLIVTNSTSNTVSVYRNTSVNGIISSGSFAPKEDFTTLIYKSSSFIGYGPQGVSIGDIDGDGKLDLVLGTQDGQGLIFRNTSSSGSLSFDLLNSFNFGHKTWGISIGIGDMDGDGKLDLISTGFNSITDNNRVSILKNKSTSGNISFDPVVTFYIGPSNGPRGVSTGDIDGDGKLDIVVANLSSAKVSVLQNYSQDTIYSGIQSSISSKIDFAIGNYKPWGLSIGDVDGDGKLDIVVSNSGTNTVSVLRNTSTGGTISTSSFAAKVDFTTGSAPYNVSIGDIDGDGKMDLAVANSGSNNVSVLKNTSTSGTITSGSFASKVDFTTGASPYNVSIGDIDGDGKVDLAVTNGISNTVSVLKNVGFYSIPTITSFTPTTAPSGTLVTIKGTNLSGTTIVKFGVINATSFTVINDSIIQAVVGNGSTGLISVITPFVTAVSSGTFTYIPAPTINSFTPTSATSGAIVTITGTNFTSATIVKFGGINATSFTVVSNNIITAVVGSGESGMITVTTPGGTVTSSGTFTYIPPTISSFTPTSAPSGAIVTITGTNFTGATIVKFGGINATNFTVVSDNTITAEVGSGASGIITITTPGGIATSSGTFTYIPAPIINSFTPTSSYSGTIVTITGINFTGATNVKFGGINAMSFTILSATSISAVVGNGATGTITVTTPGGTTNSSVIFTYISKTAPTITTTAITNISNSAATSGGNITSDGGSSITSKGVCWSTTTNPTIANSKTNEGIGNGVFTSNLTALQPNTLYYVRAYATNILGTSYGNQITFSSGSTSVDQKIKEGNNFLVFPNPSNGTMFLKANIYNYDLIEINAMNILGECNNIKYNLVENGLLELNIPENVTGIFTLEIKINGVSYFEKVSVLKK